MRCLSCHGPAHPEDRRIGSTGPACWFCDWFALGDDELLEKPERRGLWAGAHARLARRGAQ